MKANGYMKVEKGVPIPEGRAGGGRGYQAVLRTLKVGESVVLPTKAYANTWTTARTALGNGNFALRKEENGGYRVWRTK